MNVKSRLLRLILLTFTGVALSAANGQSRMAVPSYSIPGDSTWNTWASEGPSAVGLMIINLNNGDDTKYHAAVDQTIRTTRKKGIFVVGYVYTQYGKRAPATVHSRIDSVYRNYLVDGIFFDEVPTVCDASNPLSGTQFQYYEELTNYVRRQQVGGRLTVLNPGTQSPNDCWMGIRNILVNAEANGLADYQNNFTDYAWTHQYPPERFWHIVYAVSMSDMQTVIDLALRRGAAWVYVTDATLPNPYDTVPSYWTSEANSVMQQGVQAPFATSWLDSSDGKGGIKPGRVAFRWHAVNGSDWQIFLDTDQNASTGYHGRGILVGADYLFEAKADGSATLSVYTGNGTNWSWSPVSANAAISFPDAGTNLGQFDAKAIAPSQVLNHQIRSLDAKGNTLFTSYVIPLSLNNTAFIFDVLDH